MKKTFFTLLLFQVFTACSILPFLASHEHIAGVTIMSIQEIETKTGETVREIRGEVPTPFETNEEWILALQTINKQKRVDGLPMVILIFLPDENWETGVPYVRAKYKNKGLTSLKVDGVAVLLKKP
ncbi:MAG: hypothetical protein ISR87_00705 [Candidatus Marinimicrobia bacterium]|nr:hypothetical protein [FCB group bacterium]MBL7023945.1 hypothetical protein [Candidatus Neomarinimicrobiota bacterium]